MATPWQLIDAFNARQAQAASQDRSSADQMLLQMFQEEAARQRPYAQMPAQLAQAEFDRRNAEKYNVRSDQRRYSQQLGLIRARAEAKAKEEAAKEGGVATTVDEDGNEVIIVDGVAYKV